MATRIYTACDRCEEQGTDSPGITRGPFEGRTLDLCDACWDEVAKPLMALVADRGAPVRPAKAKGRPKAPPGVTRPSEGVLPIPVAGRASCPICGHVGITREVPSHLREAHGVEVTRCPVCGKASARVGQHAGKAHTELGRMDTVSALEWARDNGDPHGVYAEVVRGT